MTHLNHMNSVEVLVNFIMLCMLILLFTSVTCMDPVTQDLVTPLRYIGEACGYESCPRIKQNMINVHIVPHTHGELGYTRTFYQHYTGNDDFYDKSQINMRRILDYTITELWANEKRKFTLSDMPYFFHWWSNRDGTAPLTFSTAYGLRIAATRASALRGGGWSMSDEATTSYHAIIDHFTYNLRKINATFLSCGRPLVTWQADVLGHSKEFASLMAQMGFDGHFVSPISFEDELARMKRKALEFVWRGSDDLGAESDIYSHKLFDGYWSPPGFCFGGLCSDPLLITSDTVFKNIDDRLDVFFKNVLHRQAPYYSTNNLMMMMGQRLGYYDASVWFANIDKLIDHANNKTMNGTRINVFYSTPACYLKAVHDANPQLPTKQDDFLPLGYDVTSYATGMYTSRPTIKYMAREGHLYLQITKQLHVTARLRNYNKFFEEYNWINGVQKRSALIPIPEPVQHIPYRTSKSRDELVFLAEDLPPMGYRSYYVRDHQLGWTRNKRSIIKKMNLNNNKKYYISQTNSVKTDDHDILINKANNYEVSNVKKDDDYEYFDDTTKKSETKILFVTEMPDRAFVVDTERTNNNLTIIDGPNKFDDSELSEDDGVENKRKPDDDIEYGKAWRGSYYVNVTDSFIRNRYIKINIDKHGRVQLVQLLNGLNMSLDVQFYFYASDDPVKSDATRKKPGAYIFRAMDPKPEVILDHLDTRAYKNGLLQELHSQFSDYASFAVRLYRRTPYIELEWMVGPVPVRDDIGKEVFVRYSTDLVNNGVFYTDSNGRQTVKRVRNTRASFELANQDPVAGNYYPVTSKIYIEDVKKNIRFSVFNDRAQGGGSLNDGQIDIMLNRRVLTDDSGIQAIMNETEHGKGVIVRGKHYLYITKANYKPNKIFEKKFAKEIELKPSVFVSKKSVYGKNSKRIWKEHTNEFSCLNMKLPLGIHILTLEKWNDDTILLRIENYLEKSDIVKDGVKKVFLNKIFKNLKFLDAKETTLGAHMWLKDWVPLQWDRYESF
ncbi:lysosomal alpha-mannosidase [Aphomia sociella]